MGPSTAKEYDVPKQKQPSPEDSTPTPKEKEVAKQADSSEEEIKAHQNGVDKTISQHGKKEAFSNKITDESKNQKENVAGKISGLPKKDETTKKSKATQKLKLAKEEGTKAGRPNIVIEESPAPKVSDESPAIEPKEKLTERAETTEEQKHSHFYDSGLTEQDTLVAQKKLDISIEESTIQGGNVDVLVENSDVAQKEEVDHRLQERESVEKPNISMHAADVKDANDSIYEQMHPKERTE